ncbi:MAG: ABC transporter ATP-binding protein [Thaumarchaeota archaeon]|nr:ABC transporter ATP-binding protein [Nitrososphaerota archaeon]
MASLMIEVANLTKRYGGRNGVSALDDVTFLVNDGEIVGFVGLNGAGKTTTIRIASGVALPSSGKVTIDGHDIVRHKREASESVGWVPEFPNYEQNSRAKSLLLYFAGFHQIESGVAERRASELFQKLELSGHERKKLAAYSQGMKKRFSLALALLPDPKNLLFDEVLNGLDPQGIQFIRSLLMDLRKKGKSVLLSSHILSEIEAMSDRIVFINRGKIIKIVTKDELAAIERSKSVLRMVVPNLSDVGLGYLRTLGSVSIESGSVTLSGFEGDPSAVSAELVRRGFLLREFSSEKSSLEEYFLRLIAESNASQEAA